MILLRRPVLLVLIAALILSSAVPLLITSGYALQQPYDDELKELYIRVYRLGREGIDVSDIVNDMNRVVELVNAGRLDEADKLIRDIESRVARLETEAGDILFWENFRKYSVVAILISLPIIAYIFLPRLYLEAWYRLRRRWLVKR